MLQHSVSAWAILTLFMASACVRPFRHDRSSASNGDASKEEAAKAQPVASAPVSPSVADARADAALTDESGGYGWRTRPPRVADLYPALDGFCQWASVSAVDGATFLGFRGLRRFTIDGLEEPLDASLATAESTVIPRGGGIDEVGGRWPNVFAVVTVPGSTFRSSGLIRWTGREWQPVLPHLSKRFDDLPEPRRGADWIHHYMPEPWREGYLGLACPVDAPEAEEYADLFEIGLPANAAIDRLFPAGIEIGQLRGLPTGEIVALAYERSQTNDLSNRKPRLYLLGPRDEAARAEPLNLDAGATLVGNTREQLRVITETGVSYRLEGDTFVRDRPESGEPAWQRDVCIACTRHNHRFDASHWAGRLEWALDGERILRRQGAGWTQVALPPLPFSGPQKVHVERVTIASDGEAFVTVSRTGSDALQSAATFYALYRSRRPRETLRCSEPNLDDHA